LVPLTVVVFSPIEADSSRRMSMEMPLLAGAEPLPVPLPAPERLLLAALTAMDCPANMPVSGVSWILAEDVTATA